MVLTYGDVILSNNIGIEKILKYYKNDGFFIAIDDFGTGHAGYKLLYDATPNVLKIDRYFIQEIQNNTKKKILLKSIVNLSLELGIEVIAEGVETKEEFIASQDIGCHYIQGYYIEKPILETDKIKENY